MTDTTMTTKPHSPFGQLMKEWRRTRALSQLDLALDCGVSQRHVSFLESGRANPSRGMILHLASALAVPLRQQNEMLLAAGFAPVYGSRSLDAPEMHLIANAISRTLEQQEPYPAVVVDRRYNLLRSNRAAAGFMMFMLGLDAEAAGRMVAEGVNLAHMLLSEQGLKPHIENWEEMAVWFARRLRADALLEGDDGETSQLLADLIKDPDFDRIARTPRDDTDHPPALTVTFVREGTRLSLFSMIASIGTPMDVSVQDIHVEFNFPADDETEAWFQALVASQLAMPS